MQGELRVVESPVRRHRSKRKRRDAHMKASRIHRWGVHRSIKSSLDCRSNTCRGIDTLDMTPITSQLVIFQRMEETSGRKAPTVRLREENGCP